MRDGLRSALTVVGGYVIVGAVLLGGVWLFEPVGVAGGSMSPALESGDVVLVRRGARCEEGDIALVREPGHGAVLHRVVGRTAGGGLRLKGDANPVADFAEVPASAVSGRVVRVIPVGALLVRWRGR